MKGRVKLFFASALFLMFFLSFVSAVGETVFCIFENSEEEHECFATYGVESFWLGDEVIRFGCKGVGSCEAVVDFSDEIIEKYDLDSGDLDLAWRNMEGCLGDKILIIDGKDKDVTFDCGPINSSKGFLYAVWECSDGIEKNGGDGEICKSKYDWQRIAREDCEVTVHSDGSFGNIIDNLISFEVSQEYYLGEQAYSEETGIAYSEETGEPMERPLEDGTCESGGCAYNLQCHSPGKVLHYHYCSVDREFVKQLDNGELCKKDFECISHSCRGGECKIPSFFTRLSDRIIGLFIKNA